MFQIKAWSIIIAAAGFVLLSTLTQCSKDGGVNVFSLEDDRKLGLQLKQEIENNPQQYPILSEQQYPKAYEHIRRITNTVLNSGKVIHRDDFNWEVRIIHDDATLNAFCAPGGYMCVYTGLVKFLDHESELAGVMGHEIAHADLRHSTEQMTKAYGLQTLLDIVLGRNRGALATIAQNLTLLKFSRSNESEADAKSVEYLCPTEYDNKGTAGFFQKLIDSGSAGNTPQFLSTHPNPDNRVEAITKKANSMSCTQGGQFTDRLTQFKSVLP